MDLFSQYERSFFESAYCWLWWVYLEFLKALSTFEHRKILIVGDCSLSFVSLGFNTPKQHKIVRAIDKFSPILDNKVPGRFSNHLKYLRLMDDTQTVTCIICKTKPFNWKDIPLHLIQPSHLAMTKTETLNYVYHCDVCDRRYHDEMSWIIHFQDNDERFV